MESEDSLVEVLVDEQVEADARLGVVDVDGGEGELKVQERHLDKGHYDAADFSRNFLPHIQLLFPRWCR